MGITVMVDRKGDRVWVGTLTDDQWPGLEVVVRYDLSEEGDFTWRGFAVGWAEDALGVKELGVSDIRREFPIAEWERQARLGVLEEIMGRPEHVVYIETPRGTPLPRLLLIAMQYRENIERGLRDPVAEIARHHGVREETARAWVFRARQAGWLGKGKPGRVGEFSAPASTSAVASEGPTASPPSPAEGRRRRTGGRNVPERGMRPRPRKSGQT